MNNLWFQILWQEFHKDYDGEECNLATGSLKSFVNACDLKGFSQNYHLSFFIRAALPFLFLWMLASLTSYMPWRQLEHRRYSCCYSLTSPVDGGEWSALWHPSCALHLKKGLVVPIRQGHQSSSAHRGQKKNSLPLLRIDAQALSIVRQNTDWPTLPLHHSHYQYYIYIHIMKQI